jgi:hypothetical protein
MAKDGDTGRSTVRQLNLRDHLWRTFELMAADQEKSIDELVNDALAAYAQIAGYETTGSRDSSPGLGVAGSGSGSGSASPPPASGDDLRRRVAARPSSGPAGAAPAEGLQRMPAGIAPRPGPGPASGSGPNAAPGIASAPGAGHPPGAVPGRFGRPPFGAGGPPAGAPAAGAPPSSSSSALAPRPSGAAAPADGAGATGSPVLYLVFDQQRYRIDKDQFIIGRGSKSSDLPIKDGNISRKHEAVIRRNGTFFINDLGSTNGIDFKGMRIDNKRIDEGDVFHICEYELKFTYKR